MVHIPGSARGSAICAHDYLNFYALRRGNIYLGIIPISGSSEVSGGCKPVRI